jgi:biotin synthase-related radical SAM superfamily protein
MAYRTAVNETAKITALQMMLGREMRMPIDLLVGQPESNANLVSETDYARNLEGKLNRIHMFACENLQQSSTVNETR